MSGGVLAVAGIEISATGVAVGGTLIADAVNGISGNSNIQRFSKDWNNLMKANTDEKVKSWSDGGEDSSQTNAEKHYGKHGYEVKAKDFDDYLRKAEAFKDTVLQKKIKGIYVSGATENVYRYNYNGKYIDLERLSNGTYKIISYGVNIIKY